MVPPNLQKSPATAPELKALPTTHPASEITKPTQGAYNGFTLDGKARPKVDSSVSVVLGNDGSPQAVTKPVEIPKNISWSEPQTVVKAAAGAIPKGTGRTAILSFVIDGDTAQLKSTDGKKDDGTHWNNGQIRCRLETLNADEVANSHKGSPAQPFANEEKRNLEQMLANREVNVMVVRPTKTYDRSICQIRIEGKNIDEALLANGFGTLYRRYAKDFLDRAPMLEQLEAGAKARKAGRWANPNAVDPETFSHGK